MKPNARIHPWLHAVMARGNNYTLEILEQTYNYTRLSGTAEWLYGSSYYLETSMIIPHVKLMYSDLSSNLISLRLHYWMPTDSMQGPSRHQNSELQGICAQDADLPASPTLNYDDVYPAAAYYIPLGQRGCRTVPHCTTSPALVFRDNCDSTTDQFISSGIVATILHTLDTTKLTRVTQ